jgi:hypothetical protein
MLVKIKTCFKTIPYKNGPALNKNRMPRKLSVMKPVPAIILPDVARLEPESAEYKQYEFPLSTLVENVNSGAMYANNPITYAFEEDRWTLVGASGGDIIEIIPLHNSHFRIKYMASSRWMDCCYRSTGVYNMLVWAICNLAYSNH